MYSTEQRWQLRKLEFLPLSWLWAQFNSMTRADILSYPKDPMILVWFINGIKTYLKEGGLDLCPLSLFWVWGQPIHNKAKLRKTFLYKSNLINQKHYISQLIYERQYTTSEKNSLRITNFLVQIIIDIIFLGILHIVPIQKKNIIHTHTK